MIGEGRPNDDVLSKFREMVLQHRRAEFWELFALGVQAGELDANIDVEVATGLVYDPVG